MQPVSIEGAEIATLPGDPSGDLPILVVHKEDGKHMYSCWKPSYEDLQNLNNGGVILLETWGQRHPVVAMDTLSPDHIIKSDNHGNTNENG